MINRKKGLVILNTTSLVFMLFFNFAASTGMFAGQTVGEVSHQYDTLFAPADYAFIIWGVIFLLLTAFVTYQWFLRKNGDPVEYIPKTGIWFFISNLANALWLYSWTHNHIGTSVILILLLLLCLCVLVVRLRLELDDAPLRTIFFVWWPIVIYLGWIMVASIACIASWLVYKGWSGGVVGEVGWTIIMIIIAAGLYLLLINSRNLREAALVGVWAFIAIAVRQWNNELPIAITAMIASLVLLVRVAIHGYRNRHFTPVEKIKRNEWK